MDTKTKLNRLDLFILIALVFFIVAYSLLYYDFSIPPFEDAAMLMRYSIHLAEGHGIVWNIGEIPVDGATDFLFMIFLSLLFKLGLPVEISARIIGFISHILTVIIIYIAIRKLYKANRWIASISAVYLGIGPGLAYIAACFGTTLFALAVCITWYLANKYIKEKNSQSTPLMFAVSGLIMGLIRPEGVFLAILMLISILYINGLKESRRIILYFLIIFIFLGGLYFFWRWSYFGYPLPNPFYKKGGGTLYFYSLVYSVKNVILLCLPVVIIFVLGFRNSHTTRKAIFSIIPIAGFTVIWILLSNKTNFLMRFQYAALPIALISWHSLVKGIYKEWKISKLNDLDMRSQKMLISFIVIILLVIIVYQHEQYSKANYFLDERYEVAVMLNEYSHKNYTIATTEAGLLPLYSNWRAIDTWGLNNQWIAHNGKVTESYLERFKPEIIVFHGYFSPMVPLKGEGEWFSMVMTLKKYAEKNEYHLSAVFGESPHSTRYYYVRPSFPESEEIVRKIQNIDYIKY